jgi:hypothetical protein
MCQLDAQKFEAFTIALSGGYRSSLQFQPIEEETLRAYPVSKRICVS